MVEKPSIWQQDKLVKAVHITEDKETESMMGITNGMIFEGPPLGNHSASEASLLKIPYHLDMTSLAGQHTFQA